jgi:hypothetical protein
MTREIRCPEHATCNRCKSSSGKLLFKVVSKEQVPAGVVVEIVCPQLRGKVIRVEV